MKSMNFLCNIQKVKIISHEINFVMVVKLQFLFKASSTDGISNPKCTICSEQLFVLNPSNIRNHPVLGVLICKVSVTFFHLNWILLTTIDLHWQECLEFYNAGHFTKDDEGHDEYCRWCGEGGLLICCDVCTNVFCKVRSRYSHHYTIATVFMFLFYSAYTFFKEYH